MLGTSILCRLDKQESNCYIFRRVSKASQYYISNYVIAIMTSARNKVGAVFREEACSTQRNDDVRDFIIRKV